jgi:hypothetical protein
MRQDVPAPCPDDRILCLVPPPHLGRRVLPRRPAMADVAYVLLVIGGFAVLALTVRGLQRL